MLTPEGLHIHSAFNIQQLSSHTHILNQSIVSRLSKNLRVISVNSVLPVLETRRETHLRLGFGGWEERDERDEMWENELPWIALTDFVYI